MSEARSLTHDDLGEVLSCVPKLYIPENARHCPLIFADQPPGAAGKPPPRLGRFAEGSVKFGVSAGAPADTPEVELQLRALEEAELMGRYPGLRALLDAAGGGGTTLASLVGGIESLTGLRGYTAEFVRNDWVPAPKSAPAVSVDF